MNILIDNGWYENTPKDWNIERMKNIMSPKNERSKTGEEELLSVTINNGVVRRKDYLNDEEGGSRSETLEGYKLVNKNDLVNNIMKMSFRCLGVSKFEGIVSPAYSVFSLNKCKISPVYLNYLLRINLYILEFRKLSKGIQESRMRLYDDYFLAMKVIVPPLIEQRTISQHLDQKTQKIDSLIEKIEEKIELLKEQKSSLINKYTTEGLYPNVEKRNSGIEWSGEIPKHWEVKKMPWISFFQEGPGLRNWQFVDKGTPVVCVTNITPEGLNFKKYKRNISNEEYFQQYKHFTVQKNDLLLASSGNSFGKICQYKGEFDFPFILNTSTIRIRSLNEEIIKTKYIYFLIQSEVFQNQIKILITGSAQPNFGPTHLQQVKIPVPSIKEQEEIIIYLGEKLDTLNRVIEKESKKLILLNEYRESLISSVVTGKIRITEDML